MTRSEPPPRRDARKGGAKLLAALAGLAWMTLGPVPVAARDLSLSLSPQRPTWGDHVQLRVSGDVDSACGAGVVHLINLRAGYDPGVGPTVDVDLFEDPCSLPPPPVPVGFDVDLDLGVQPPGLLTVKVHDASDGDVEGSLTVYQVSRLGLALPERAKTGSPLILGVIHTESCFSLDHRVDGNVIELFYDGTCPVIPLGGRPQRTNVDLGLLPAGDYEVRLLDNSFRQPPEFPPSLLVRPLRIWEAGGCLPSPNALCLHHGRFEVTAIWYAPGVGNVYDYASSLPLSENERTGLFWFFDSGNAELTVKLLDGCAVNGRWWTFVSSSSTVEYWVMVKDTRSGVSKTYHKPLGSVPELLADVGAFPCP